MSVNLVRMMNKELTSNPPLTRKRRIESLNRNLASEYRAIIATVVYGEVLKRNSHASVAEELERHAAEGFRHAREIAKQIAVLGGVPCVMLEDGRTSMEEIAMCLKDPDWELQTLGDYQYPIHSARIGSRVTPHSHSACHGIV